MSCLHANLLTPLQCGEGGGGDCVKQAVSVVRVCVHGEGLTDWNIIGVEKNESQKGREERIREEDSAAHGKHMSYMDSASVEMHIWIGGGCWSGKRRWEEEMWRKDGLTQLGAVQRHK